jgi:ABC-type Fe3+ transport system permease subunit
MIKGPSASMNIISASILANIPQVVLAVLFFSYTYVLTEMVSFSYISKPSPTVKQLAEPAKKLPKYYSIVIAVVATVVLWMASLALFVISVQISPYGDDTGSWFLNVGYSPMAIIFTIILGVGSFLTLVVVGDMGTYKWE